MKVSELTKLAGLQPDDEVLIVRNDVGPGLAPHESQTEAIAEPSSVDDVVKEALLRAWPVGCYYKGTQDPSTIIGGSWTEINGRFLYAMETGSSVGSTGGAETVTLTTSHLPSHSHTVTKSGKALHTHTVRSVSHTHTVPGHSHKVTISAHSHSIGSHTHAIPTHRHDVRNARQMQQEGRYDLGLDDSAAGFKGRCFVGYGSTSAFTVSGTTKTTFTTVNGTIGTPSYTVASGAGELYNSASLSGTISTDSNRTVGTSSSAGGNVPHTNMPPTEICRIWRRIS